MDGSMIDGSNASDVKFFSTLLFSDQSSLVLRQKAK